jgi:hypothetical protein
VGYTVGYDVDGVDEGDDFGTEEEGKTVACEVVATVVGADVSIEEVGDTIDYTWSEQSWARTSGSMRSVTQKAATWSGMLWARAWD